MYGAESEAVTYLRLNREIVEKRVQLLAASEDWSAALRKQFLKAEFLPFRSSGKRCLARRMCSNKGRGENVIVVSASLTRTEGIYLLDRISGV
jgi:hypothetical protein